MKKKNYVCISALTILAASFIVPVSAEAILVKHESVDPWKLVNIEYSYSDGTVGYSGGVYAGIYNLTVDGKPFESFCIDVFNYVPGSEQNYSIKDLGGSEGIFSETAVDDINQLWATYYYAEEEMSALEIAALQVALWEVTTEDILDNTGQEGFSYNLANNDGFGFSAWDYSGYVGVVEQASSYLANLQTTSYNGPSSPLVALTNDNKQDFLFTTQVPEPATLILLGSGIIGTAFVRRRKSIKS